MQTKKTIYIPIIFILFLTSCGKDTECRENIDVGIQVNFYAPTVDEEKHKIIIKPLSDTIFIKGVNMDSVINKDKPISGIKLSLNPLSETTEYIIQKNNIADTVTFHHTNIEQFISLECGVVFFHKITDVISTNNNIDSIQLSDNMVNAEKKKEQLKIYFKVKK